MTSRRIPCRTLPNPAGRNGNANPLIVEHRRQQDACRGLFSVGRPERHISAQTPRRTSSSRRARPAPARKPSGCRAPARSPTDQRPTQHQHEMARAQTAPSILARRISHPESGVAIRPSQVSRSFSAATPSAANPATIRNVKHDDHRRGLSQDDIEFEARLAQGAGRHGNVPSLSTIIRARGAARAWWFCPRRRRSRARPARRRPARRTTPVR